MMRSLSFYVVVLLLIPANLIAVERKLLENSITREQLSRVLVENTEWVKSPAYHNRQAWESLSPEVRNSAIHKGEDALKCDWPVIRATDYLEFTRSGNRQVMEQPQNIRVQAVRDLALAELIEGKGRFIEPLVNGVWAICEQSSWMLSACLNLQKTGAGLPDPDEYVIDLTVGDIGAMMSWIHYYFASEFDKINPNIAKRLQKEVKQRVLDPYYTRNDFWWMGFNGGMVNNWNVWVNYNVMQCILLMETDRKKRADNIYKAMLSIDKFINYYPADGGCDEGPGYWGHAGGKLFEGLELLYSATNKAVDLFQNELIKDIGRYIYRAYIGDPYFVNFADASAKGSINPGLVYRYGKTIGDEALQGFGTFYAQKSNMSGIVPSGTLEVVVRNLFDAKEIVSGKSGESLILESWLPESQFVMARDRENSKEGFLFAAKGGYNDESHNHNDVGTFILYYNGLPVLIDVGVGTYTRQTFSAERYSIWTMQSGYHNLPVINGIEQKNGKQYAARKVAFRSNAKTVEFSLDIAGAYPGEAHVKTWKRKYILQRGISFTINDQYNLSENTGKNALHFMTSCKATITRTGTVRLEGEGFVLELSYNRANFNPQVENITITDPRLQDSWGNNLTRIILDNTNRNMSANNQIVIKAIKQSF
jgi:hypothetical protein